MTLLPAVRTPNDPFYIDEWGCDDDPAHPDNAVFKAGARCALAAVAQAAQLPTDAYTKADILVQHLREKVLRETFQPPKHSYTKVDIRRVLECVAADLSMLASRTAAWTDAEVNDFTHDLKILALEGMLASVHIHLLSVDGAVQCAHAYYVQDANSPAEAEAKGIAFLSNQRPGDNDWPKLPGGRMELKLVYVADLEKDTFQRIRPSLRKSYPDPVEAHGITYATNVKPLSGRTYASNGYVWIRKSYTFPENQAAAAA